MALYGVIDLGSNSVRLVIYEVKASTLEVMREKRRKTARHLRELEAGDVADPKEAARIMADREALHSQDSRLFKTILDEKKMACLAAYVRKGVFGEDGIDRAVDVLKEHLKSAADLDCRHVRIFATAVLRNCSNSQEAVKAIEKRIDHPIDVLPEEDEAHLGYVGATCDRIVEGGTLVDIGGGSTELTAMEADGDHSNVSLSQGSVSSYAEYVRLILPTAEEQRAIAEGFASKLRKLGPLGPYGSDRLYGIGGGIRVLAKMCGRAFHDGVKPASIPKADIERLLKLLEDDPSAFAHMVVKASPDRVHTAVPSCLIALTIMEAIGAGELIVCKYGIREGYLLERMLKIL